MTSVDNEGTLSFDDNLVKEICKNISLPVIVSGGFGKLNIVNPVKKFGADAIAIAHCLHYNKFSLREIRDFALNKNIKVRKFNQ